MITQKLLTSLLLTLGFAPAPLSVHDLRRDLERTHMLAASAAMVRGALALLEQAGLVRLHADRALLTEAGEDVSAMRVPMPDLV